MVFKHHYSLRRRWRRRHLDVVVMVVVAVVIPAPDTTQEQTWKQWRIQSMDDSLISGSAHNTVAAQRQLDARFIRCSIYGGARFPSYSTNRHRQLRV